MEGCYVLMDWSELVSTNAYKRLGIKTFMSHFQSFVQISKILIQICVFNLIIWSWRGGAELNIHKAKIKYQAAKLLSFAS